MINIGSNLCTQNSLKQEGLVRNTAGDFFVVYLNTDKFLIFPSVPCFRAYVLKPYGLGLVEVFSKKIGGGNICMLTPH